MKTKAKADSPTLMPWFALGNKPEDEFEVAAQEFAKKIEGIAHVQDESDRVGVRSVSSTRSVS